MVLLRVWMLFCFFVGSGLLVQSISWWQKAIETTHWSSTQGVVIAWGIEENNSDYDAAYEGFITYKYSVHNLEHTSRVRCVGCSNIHVGRSRNEGEAWMSKNYAAG